MKDETQVHMDSTASQFRQVAGLPERTSNEPHNPLEPSELRRQPEPEGGYAGRGETEVDEREGVVDEKVVEGLSYGEELSAKSGQGTTSPVDASTGPTEQGAEIVENGEPVDDEDEEDD